MAGFALDSNCLIAAVLDDHHAHLSVQREIERRLGGLEAMILPAHALTEAFSVLTRLPAPQRLTPQQAKAALDEGFLKDGSVSALDAAAYVAVITRVAAAGIAGGRVYDEVIAETAVRAGATVLVTLNPKHFPAPPRGLSIVDPTVPPLPEPDENP